MQKSNKGFASLSPERRREVASLGGKRAQALGKAHRFTPEEASAAGRKGGLKVSQSPGHMSKIGQNGGRKIADDHEHMTKIGSKGRAAQKRFSK